MWQAHQWQQSGEYKTAVDCYLRVNNNNCKDPNTVLKALTEAAHITNKYLEGEEGFAAAKAICESTFNGPAKKYELYLQSDEIGVGNSWLNQPREPRRGSARRHI